MAEVAGPGLNSHVGTVLPPLLVAMSDDDVVSCLYSFNLWMLQHSFHIILVTIEHALLASLYGNLHIIDIVFPLFPFSVPLLSVPGWLTGFLSTSRS